MQAHRTTGVGAHSAVGAGEPEGPAAAQPETVESGEQVGSRTKPQAKVEDLDISWRVASVCLFRLKKKRMPGDQCARPRQQRAQGSGGPPRQGGAGRGRPPPPLFQSILSAAAL